ncbi:MAG: hypothetical protein U0768_18730 [Anaerolineae bacterium]
MKGFFKTLLVLGLVGVIAYAVYKVVQGLLGQPSGTGDGGSAAGPGPLMGGDDGLTINEADLGGEVAPDLLEILVDPTDKQPLELVDGKWLVNRRTGRRYPIVTGIPIMLPEVGEKYRDPSLITAGHNGA